jgi:hypothetical protein
MNLLKREYIDAYNRIAQWNFIAGNTSHESSDMANQITYTLSEIDELREHQKTVYADRDVQLTAYIDDLSDIFVTSSFFNFQMNAFNTCSIYHYDIEERSIFDIPSSLDEHNALRIMCSDWKEFDMISVITKVMDSNFTKFVPLKFMGVVAESFEQLSNEHGSVYIVENQGYAVFKRESDNKILKPITYRSPDNLAETIYGKNNQFN